MHVHVLYDRIAHYHNIIRRGCGINELFFAGTYDSRDEYNGLFQALRWTVGVMYYNII